MQSKCYRGGKTATLILALPDSASEKSRTTRVDLVEKSHEKAEDS
jgi:hypothetical protein